MEPMSFAVTIEGHGETTAQAYVSDAESPPCLVLAHGAGAGQRHPFMVGAARALSARGVDVVTFDFLYMGSGRRSPDRPPVLEATWRAVIATVRQRQLARSPRLVVGGKSMGGRIASMVLASPEAHATTPGGWDSPKELESPHVTGLVLLGYPLHPPGQPDKLRTAHLPALQTPTLVVQGSRDEFGTEAEVKGAFAVVPAPVSWHIVSGGDHSFKVSKSGGTSPADVMTRIYDAVAKWIGEIA
jgi:predicted alpha/beta-hydrolase family hydrolase